MMVPRQFRFVPSLTRLPRITLLITAAVGSAVLMIAVAASSSEVLGQEAQKPSAEDDHEGHDHEGHDHAGHDHAGAGAGQAVAPAPRADVERLVAKAEAALVTDFLHGYAGAFAEAEAIRLKAPLREFTGRLDEWLSVNDRNPGTRVAARADLHAKIGRTLEAALTAGGSTPERAAEVTRAAMETADQAVYTRRKKHIVDHLMCWCPKPACDFTRTLAGCPDPCANEQKSLVGAWIREGLSDEEIFQRMVVNPKGGPRVLTLRVEGAQRFGFYLPILLAMAGGCVVIWLLSRSVKRGQEHAALEFSAPAEAQDSQWGNEIERELKELDA
jgi:hypothetical protein